MFTNLNNKGYMLIEMILASVIAFTIAYFAIDMTIKIKNKNDDLLVETLVATDQTILASYVVKDIINYYGKNEFGYAACPDYQAVESFFKGNQYVEINYDYKGLNQSGNYSIRTEDCYDNPAYHTLIQNVHLIVKQLPDKNFDVLVKFRHATLSNER